MLVIVSGLAGVVDEGGKGLINLEAPCIALPTYDIW